MKRSFLVTLLIMGLVLSVLSLGCGAKRVRTPGGPKVSPPSSAKPASQRPYTINGRTYYPIATARGYDEKGLASWYGRRFHGRKTASGERYDMYAMTAAHKILPLGTHVRVTNLRNGAKINLRINDRGPFVRGRIIDLSFTAAKKLGVVGPGTAPVRVTALGQPMGSGQAEGPPPTFNLGPFTVQVGAFTNKPNADRLAARVSQRYRTRATVVAFDDGIRTWHRVRVFSLKEREAAEAWLAVLAKDGFGTGIVVAVD